MSNKLEDVLLYSFEVMQSIKEFHFGGHTTLAGNLYVWDDF